MECGQPEQMKVSAEDEIVNVLNADKQNVNRTISVEAKFSVDKKDMKEALESKVKDVLSGVSDAQIQITLAKVVGADMGSIENVGLFKEEGETNIHHEPGQVILLDFWATWCPPCQKPMAHNQEMIHKHKESGDWKNVRIIGLSIDQDKQKLIKHVTDKGWTDVEHYWARNGKCTGDKDFQV